MGFTYDPSTSRGRVRLLISDTNEDTASLQLFTDAEIDAFLDLSGDNIQYAAAAALEAVAVNENLILKYIRTHGLETDGPKVAAELRQQARQLRQVADQGADPSAGGFLIAEQPTSNSYWPY